MQLSHFPQQYGKNSQRGRLNPFSYAVWESFLYFFTEFLSKILRVYSRIEKNYLIYKNKNIYCCESLTQFPIECLSGMTRIKNNIKFNALNHTRNFYFISSSKFVIKHTLYVHFQLKAWLSEFKYSFTI